MRVGYNRFRQDLGCLNNKTDLLGAVGINGAIRDAYAYGPPGISSNMSGVGCFQYGPSRPTSNTFEAMDTMALTRGAHSLKVGVDAKRSQQNGIQFPNARGTYYFGGGFTQIPSARATSGLGLADMMLGFPSSTAVSLGKSDNDIRVLNAGFFFQDDWDVSRNVTLNLGVRYEYMPWGISDRDRTSAWSQQEGAIVLSQNDLSRKSTAPGMESRTIQDTLADFPFFQFMTRERQLDILDRWLTTTTTTFRLVSDLPGVSSVTMTPS